MNYYNEHDPKAAAWLRELIKQGLIPDGVVDTRSIVDVQPSDLSGYVQCHFFAGIGGWSYALQLAGWPDDRPVWTGSCPCQPFSSAGAQRGFADERHLWPHFHRLIAQCQPPTVFGEQVASKLGREWLAGVRADLEGVGYAVGGADLCAAGVGAPHIRQRLYWVANSGGKRCSGQHALLRQATKRRIGESEVLETAGCGATCLMADANHDSGGRNSGGFRSSEAPELWIREQGMSHGPESRDYLPASRLADAEGGGQRIDGSASGQSGYADEREPVGWVGHADHAEKERLGLERIQMGSEQEAIGPDVANPWSQSDLIGCADGRARRVESGTFPLAHGVPARVGRLRGYGNAIVPQVAAAFIQASEESRVRLDLI